MPPAPPIDVQAEIAAAIGHLNRGDLAAANLVCDRLLQAPEHPAVLQLAATAALRAGRPDAALDRVTRALVLRPGHVPSLLLAGQAARAAGRPALALAPLREAAQCAPDLAEAAFLLCHILLDLDDPSLQQALTETAARHAAASASWQRLGVTLLRGGRAAAARAALQHAVAHDPNAGAWFALGLTCQDLGDDAAASEAYEAALRARPDLAEAAVNLGTARQRLGDMEAALDAYRQAIRIRPDTFARVAQAVTSARTGMLCLNVTSLRRLLGA